MLQEGGEQEGGEVEVAYVDPRKVYPGLSLEHLHIQLRELLKNKMQLDYGLLPKGGRGSKTIQKFWDTFCAPTILEFWAEKGGGLTKSKSFWTLLTLILVKYNTKIAPKVPRKKSAYKKVSQKFQKSEGAG